MRISKVMIKNFRGYAKNIEGDNGYFTFDDLDKYKIVLFNGFNGFGKTSFFDAIEWCLTGKLKRFDEMKNVLMKVNLNSSNHLKFNGAKSEDYADVLVEFDDGSIIRRRTKSTSMFNDNYSWEVFLNNNCSSDKEILNYFEARDLPISSMIDINFLGQDGIDGLLRSKKASERTKYLSSLVGLGGINNISNLSKSNKFTAAKNKLEQASSNIENYGKREQQYNELLKKMGRKSIDEIKNNFMQLNSDLKVKSLEIENNEDGSENISMTQLIELNDFFGSQSSYLTRRKGEIQESIDNYKKKIFLLHWKSNVTLADNLRILNGYKYLDLKKEIDDTQHLLDDNKMKVDSKNEILDKLKNSYRCIDYFNYSDEDQLIDNCEILKLTSMNTILHNIIVLLKYNKVYDESIFVPKLINLDDIMAKNTKLLNIIKEKDKEINVKKKFVENLSSLNENYKTVLNTVSEYISNNSEIEGCPICLNTDFSYLDNYEEVQTKNDMKAKLLCIIENTIGGSDEILKKSVNALNELREDQVANFKTYRAEITNKYTEIIDSFKVSLNEYFMKYDSLINIEVTTLTNQQAGIKEELNESKKTQTLFEVSYKKAYGIPFTLDLINTITEVPDKLAVLDKKIFEIESYCNEKYFKMDKNSNQSLVEKIDVELSFLSSVESDKESFKVLRNEINDIKDDLKLLDSNKDIILTDEEKNNILKFSELKDGISKDYLIKNDLENKLEIQEELNKRVQEISSKLLEDRIKKNPCVLWIYKTINPHPYYRDFVVKHVSDRNGTNIIASENDDVYLDHIFSSAQINVLALSVFLGIGLSQNQNALDQIYMDDPIQSLDDLNLLAYIDLLRTISDSKTNRFGLILSTHDQNFCKLMKIKFRNKSLKIFDFKSYTMNGPIVEEYENNKIV